MGLLNEFLAERSKRTQEEERLLSIPDINSLSILAGLAEAKRKITSGTYKDPPFSEEDYAGTINKLKNQIMQRLDYTVPTRTKPAEIKPMDFYMTQFLPHEPGAWKLAAQALAKFQANQAVAEPLLKHYLKFCGINNFQDAVYLAMMASRGFNVPQIDAMPQDVMSCLVVREEIPKLEQEKKQLEEKIADIEKDLSQRVVKEVIKAIDMFGRPESLEQVWAGIKDAPVTNTVTSLKQLESYMQSYASAIKSEHDSAIQEIKAMLGEFKGKAADVGRRVSFLFGKPKEESKEIPEGLKALANIMFERAVAKGEAGIIRLADLLNKQKTFQVGDEVMVVKAYNSNDHNCSDPNCQNRGSKYFWGGTDKQLPVNTAGKIKKIYKEGGDTCIELEFGDKSKGSKGKWSVHPDEIEISGGIKKLFADAAKERRVRNEAAQGLDVEQLYRENNIKVGTLKELRKALPALVYEKCGEGNSGRILEFAEGQVVKSMISRYKISKEEWDYFMSGKSATIFKKLEEKFLEDLREGQPARQQRLGQLTDLLGNCNKYVKQFDA